MFRLTRFRPLLRVRHTLASNGKVQNLDKIVFQLKQMNKRLEGLSGGIALSNEQEVTEAVKRYLRCSNSNIKDITMPRLLQIPVDNIKYLKAEADGVILTDAYLAIIEVKSQVRMDALDQLERTCEIFGNYYHLPVQPFVGGPMFHPDVVEEALRRGINVVQLSGKRYRVVAAEEQHGGEKLESSA
ncbi:hypothetical protein MIR68_003821 [Amoeboaphelidium protococcarum]|nr:hypothetical protein MIR68_003821 [Amoeboaphelidium protococcarum]